MCIDYVTNLSPNADILCLIRNASFCLFCPSLVSFSLFSVFCGKKWGYRGWNNKTTRTATLSLHVSTNQSSCSVVHVCSVSYMWRWIWRTSKKKKQYSVYFLAQNPKTKYPLPWLLVWRHKNPTQTGQHSTGVRTGRTLRFFCPPTQEETTAWPEHSKVGPAKSVRSVPNTPLVILWSGSGGASFAYLDTSRNRRSTLLLVGTLEAVTIMACHMHDFDLIIHGAFPVTHWLFGNPAKSFPQRKLIAVWAVQPLPCLTNV